MTRQLEISRRLLRLSKIFVSNTTSAPPRDRALSGGRVVSLAVGSGICCLLVGAGLLLSLFWGGLFRFLRLAESPSIFGRLRAFISLGE